MELAKKKNIQNIQLDGFPYWWEYAMSYAAQHLSVNEKLWLPLPFFLRTGLGCLTNRGIFPDFTYRKIAFLRAMCLRTVLGSVWKKRLTKETISQELYTLHGWFWVYWLEKKFEPYLLQPGCLVWPRGYMVVFGTSHREIWFCPQVLAEVALFSTYDIHTGLWIALVYSPVTKYSYDMELSGKRWK